MRNVQRASGETPPPSRLLLGSSRNSRKSQRSGGASLDAHLSAFGGLQGLPGYYRTLSWGRRALGSVLAFLLLAPTVAGCRDDREESFLAEAPSVIHEANGFRFGFYGPRETGYAPDLCPSLELGLVTVEEIGLALEREALDLAARTGLNPEEAVATLRRYPIRVVDDYSFQLKGVWCAGLFTGRYIVVALWLRALAASSEEIPLDATHVRPPERGEPWRYGAKPIVPAADHELGHHYFGPRFEH